MWHTVKVTKAAYIKLDFSVSSFSLFLFSALLTVFLVSN